MKDWNGHEGLFHRGELPVEELLDQLEPHFTFQGIPEPEIFFRKISMPVQYGEGVEEKLRRERELDFYVFGRELTELDRHRDILEGRTSPGTITGITEG